MPLCEWCTRSSPRVERLGYHSPLKTRRTLYSFEPTYTSLLRLQETGEEPSHEDLPPPKDLWKAAPSKPDKIDEVHLHEHEDILLSPISSDLEVDDVGSDNTSEASTDPYANSWHTEDDPGYRGSLLELEQTAKSCDICRPTFAFFCKWVTRYFGAEKLRSLMSHLTFMEWEFLFMGVSSRENVLDGNWGCNFELIQFSIPIRTRDPDSGHHFGTNIEFQKSTPTPLHVTDILDGMGESLDWIFDELHEARTRPLVADQRLFKKWTQFCEEEHGDKCCSGSIYDNDRPHMIRLIDVQDLCLVEENGQINWFVLSYVWGENRLPVLRKDLLEYFKRPGSFSGSWVPATIADAIAVTKAMGARYIWIDCFCIIQDSDEDKAFFIPRMDAIFGLATVTIINVAGSDAFSGLPGIRPGTRSETPEPFKFKEGWMVQSLYPPPSFPDYWSIKELPWFTRAWTFQEAVLSNRWLLFTPEVVLWECRQSSWCEDASWECRNKSDIDVEPYRSIFKTPIFHQFWHPSVDAFNEVYTLFVDLYSDRMMTYDGDGLNAIQGVLNVLSKVTGFNFVWGLPDHFMGTSLTWGLHLSYPIKRRQGTSKKMWAGRLEDVRLPSWSWVGWATRMQMRAEFGSLDDRTAGLEFYVFLEDGIITHIAQYTQSRDRAEDYRLGYQVAEPSWRGDTRVPVTLSDVPAALLVPSIQPRLLMFWTSRCTLNYDGSDPHHMRGPEGLSEVFWSQFPPRECAGPVDLIIAGRHTKEHVGKGSELVAWVVERTPGTPQGAVERVGAFSFSEESWNRLPNRTWELVFLI